MHTEQANQLLEMWTALDLAIKRVESASTSNLSERIEKMMEQRKLVDDFVMELATEIFKKGL
jgi:hypothetical protein